MASSFCVRSCFPDVIGKPADAVKPAAGTDGIWEARNTCGEMFGKPRLQELIRRQADLPAPALVAAVIEAVDAFCHPLPKADDLTLVIVKILDQAAGRLSDRC